MNEELKSLVQGENNEDSEKDLQILLQRPNFDGLKEVDKLELEKEGVLYKKNRNNNWRKYYFHFIPGSFELRYFKNKEVLFWKCMRKIRIASSKKGSGELFKSAI